jgi:hypothetical protein
VPTNGQLIKKRKEKVKFSVHDKERQRRSLGRPPFILNFTQSYPKHTTPVPTELAIGRSFERYWTFSRKEKSPAPTGIFFLNYSSTQPIQCTHASTLTVATPLGVTEVQVEAHHNGPLIKQPGNCRRIASSGGIRTPTYIHTKKIHEEAELLFQVFLTSVLDACEWSASLPRLFILGKTTPAPMELDGGWAPETVLNFDITGVPV